MPRTVLITGCSSGFGFDLVKEFLQRDWNVIATLRHAEQRKALFAGHFEMFPNRLHVLELDVTQSKDRIHAADVIAKQFSGKLDCLINNAGYGLFGSLEETSEQELREQVDVNYTGPLFLTQALLPYLRASRGRIINVTSVLGYTGMPLTSAYCASKFALEGASEALFYELAPHGIQVAIVQPGGHRTRFGNNVHWASGAPSPTPTYQLQKSNYQSVLARKLTRKPVSSDAVVRTIVKLCHRDKMPLRVRVGKDANMVFWLEHLLPSAIFLKIIGFAYSKMFLRGAGKNTLGNARSSINATS